MEEIRFNLFKRVHKGLRALLADTLLQVQQTDFQINEQAAAAIERIKLVLLQWMLIHNTNRELISWMNSMNQKSTQFTLVYDLAQKALAPERQESINLNLYGNEN